MSENRKRKTIDCIEMKRKIQTKIAEETKGMTYSELEQYYRIKIAKSRFADLFEVVKTAST